MKPIFKNVKEEALRLIQKLPDDCTMEDIVYRIDMLHGIVRSLRDIEAGRVIPQEEAERRMAEWMARNKREK
jgi:hypothetical protein